jgi:uncharacterized OsmC-like protein
MCIAERCEEHWCLVTQEETMRGVMNGVDLITLGATDTGGTGTRRMPFRARNTWLGGNRSQSVVTGLYCARQEMEHKQTFRIDADEPEILAGTDDAANPVEHLLHALASCLTTSMVAHAAVRGLEIEELESKLEGDIDLRGCLGLVPNVPKGYTNIKAKFRVKAKPEDVSRLRELTLFSPVFNTIPQGAKVEGRSRAEVSQHAPPLRSGRSGCARESSGWRLAKHQTGRAYLLGYTYAFCVDRNVTK